MRRAPAQAGRSDALFPDLAGDAHLRRVLARRVCSRIPNLFSPQTVERWPAFLPKKQVSLGLDLRGGSYLLYEVDMARGARRSGSTTSSTSCAPISSPPRSAIPASPSTTTRSPSRCASRQRSRTWARSCKKIDPDLQMTTGAGGAVTHQVDRRRAAARQHHDGRAVDRDRAPPHRRDRHQGADHPARRRRPHRACELPGVDDPERVKALLGKTAKMTFQLVDTNASAEDARAGRCRRATSCCRSQDGRSRRARRTIVVQPPRHGERRHADRRAADLQPERHAGGELQIRLDRRAPLRRRDARECRQALRHRARQQGDHARR